MVKFNDLVLDVKNIITSMLDTKSLISLSRVSKEMRRIAHLDMGNKIEKCMEKLRVNHSYLSEQDLRLFASTYCGLLYYMRAAVSQGANVNARLYLSKQSTSFITPLHFAASSGSMSCVRYLVVDQKVDCLQAQSEEYYLTPANFAAAGGSVECLAYFLDQKIPRCFESAVCELFDLYWVPLKVMTKEGRAACIELLVEYGADVNYADSDGFTAIHSASARGDVACVKLLLKLGANPKVAADTVDGDGATPILNATCNRRFECVKLLLQAGADPIVFSSVRGRFRTAFIIAILDHDVNTVRAFLECHPSLANSDQRDTLAARLNREEETIPIHLAIQINNSAIVELLLEFGARIDVLTRKEKTTLQYAEESGNHEIIMLIVHALQMPSTLQIHQRLLAANPVYTVSSAADQSSALLLSDRESNTTERTISDPLDIVESDVAVAAVVEQNTYTQNKHSRGNGSS